MNLHLIEGVTGRYYLEAIVPTPRNLTLQKVAIFGMMIGAGLLTIEWVTALGILSLSLYTFHFLQGIDQEIDGTDTNLLMDAIEEGDKCRVKFLLFMGANPNVKFEDTFPLERAAVFGRTEMARELLEAGGFVNLTENEFGTTALHWAIFYHRVEMVRFLLENGARTDLRASVFLQGDNLDHPLGNARSAAQREVRRIEEGRKGNLILHDPRSRDDCLRDAKEIERLLRDRE